MERQLIKQDDNLLSQIVYDLKQFKTLLEITKATYEKLELGKFDNDILKEIAAGNINAIDKKFFEKCENDFSKLNISNNIIKENLMSGSNEVFNNFFTASYDLRKFRPQTYNRSIGLLLSQISFENDTFICSEEDKEDILESSCRIYLENDKETDLFKNLNELKEAHAKVLTSLANMQFDFRGSQKNISTIANLFFRSEPNGQTIINAGGIKYASEFEKRGF